MKCEHRVEACIHLGKEHDEDACFNGWWQHEYVCQECGHTLMSNKYLMLLRDDGTYCAPVFRPKNCPQCGTGSALV